MVEAKKILKDWRIIVLIIAVIISFIAIQPKIFGMNGAQVVYISPDSLIGNLSNNGATTFNTGSIVTSINGRSVSDSAQFYSLLNQTAQVNTTVTIGYENQVFPYVYSQNTVQIFISKDSPLNSSIIQVQDVQPTNLNYGLDLIGGTQITIAPNSTNYTSATVSNLLAVLQTRLNTYGISGISISQFATLNGANFIMISMPNVGESQALSLITNQGKFYAKVGNITVFNSTVPGDGVIQNGVCVTSGCPYGGEQLPTLTNGAYQFSFGIELTKLAAQNFANATKNLTGSALNPGYLSKPITLYLNNKQISSLQISDNLKGAAQQNILITGSGSSYNQAYNQMKTLQAVLESGSLPTPIKLISVNAVSSSNGQQFINQIYILLAGAFIAVAIVVFVRYNWNYKVASLILITSLAEIFIVFGVAAMIKWSLDIPSMAGIIASIGISVDDQIIITDEIIRGSRKTEFANVKRRVERAFFIIVVSFLSFGAIMLPLFFSTASLFTGFALTTILAAFIGLLITRPAYAKMIALVRGET